MAMSKQMRSLVSTLLVAVVGAGVVWVGYYATKASRDEKETKTKAEAKAFDFESHAVHRLKLTAGGETTVAERIEGVWRLTSPVKTLADVTVIDEIVSTLADLEAKDLNARTKPRKAPEFALADASQAGDFGLDEPSFTVKFTAGDAQAFELKVGDENPYDQSRPFLVSGAGHLRLADGQLANALNKRLFDLRDKSLVTDEASSIFSLRVTASKGVWAAQRASDGWDLTEPLTEKADKEVVDGVLGSLRRAKATAFIDDVAPQDLATYGFDEPVASVVFAVGAEKTEKAIDFGESGDGGLKKVYARFRDGGPVAVVDAGLLDELSKDIDDVRNRIVAAFDRAQATKLEATVDGESFALVGERHDGDDVRFQLVGSEEEKLKAWKVTSALYTLSTLKGQAIVTDDPTELSEWGLDSPRATYIVSGDDDVELARVLIGKEAGDSRYYAMKAGARRVYEVEKSTVDSLPKSRSELLESPPQATADAAADEE